MRLRKTGLSVLALVALCTCAAAAAHADTYQFTQTGANPLSFTIDTSTATPYNINPQDYFFLNDTSGQQLRFDDGGYLYFPSSGGYLDFGGAQLFSGNIVFGMPSPVFLPGSYTLISGYGAPGNNYLTITDLSTSAATTPEPSSLVLLGTGLLGVAGGLRRKLFPATAC